MDLNELVIFERVVRMGSFTAAARALHLPKSTVSRKVAELEERLGARLLQRTTRRLHLTDVGRAYQQHCARIVEEMEQAALAVTRMQEAPQGLLRVTAPVNHGYLGAILAEFLLRYPDVQVELVCTDRLVDLVDEGFDVAVRAGRLADSTLLGRRLSAEWRVVVASPAYLQRRGTPTSPAGLAAHDGIHFGLLPRPALWTLQSQDGAAADVPMQARLVVNDFHVLREATAAGLGIAMIPHDLCAGDIRSGRLQRLLPRWQSPDAPLHAVYPSGRHLAPKVRAFLDLLAERMRPPPPGTAPPA
ncbi:MAG: LysR family transcriptional regulator [Candidatus Lambdaproteobacteria bacterium]|nr:LysR family transcriptional regulator [Candidatus Lambdaproteobacteria bacterium]